MTPSDIRTGCRTGVTLADVRRAMRSLRITSDRPSNLELLRIIDNANRIADSRY